MIVVGVDLGRAIDFTAFVSLGTVDGDHTIRGLDRFRPEDEYGLDVLPRLGAFMERYAAPESPIVWDGTGNTGTRFGDLIRGGPLAARYPLYAVVSTHGWRKANQREDGLIFSPKRDLVTRYRLAVNRGRLRCPASLEWARELRGEMRDFVEWVGPDGLPRWGARRGCHDDIVSSLTLAIWGAEVLFGQGAGGFRSLSIPINRRSYREDSC